MPTRVVDSRSIIASNERFGSSGKVGRVDGSGEALIVNMLGKGGIPRQGVSAIIATLTVTNSTASSTGGYVTVYPGGQRPNVSHLNFKSGDTVSNSVITPLSPSGNICIYVYGSADVLLDVTGYFTGSSVFATVVPSRIYDSRSFPGRRIDNGSTQEFKVTGSGGVPASGVRAVAINVTATETNVGAEGGFASVYPCGPRPDTSNLNFLNRETRANLVIAPVSADGKICLYSYGTSHYIFDVVGYFPVSTEFVPVTPIRVSDSRISGKPNNSEVLTDLSSALGSASGIARAVSVTVTVANVSTGGYATVYPCGTGRPPTSNVNFAAGSVVANSVIVPLGSGNKICTFVAGRADVIVDLNGYFL